SGVIFESILNKTPVPLSRMNPDLPTKMEEIISKCLEKDRSLRYQHAADIRTDLQRLKRDAELGNAVAVGTKTRLSRRLMLTGAAALVFAVAVIAVAGSYYGSRRRAPIGSVAVLPFANASADPNLEYLSDGVTEGIIDRLSQLPNIKVISRTSAFHYKQRDI